MLKRAPMFKRIKVGREGGREGWKEGERLGINDRCEMLEGEQDSRSYLFTILIPPPLLPPPRSGRSTTATFPSSGPACEAKQLSSCRNHRQEQVEGGGEVDHQGWGVRWEGGGGEEGEGLC